MMLELGLPPERLIEGDPARLRASASRLRRFATALGQVSQGLQQVTTSSWQGPRAERWRAVHEVQPVQWIQAAESFEEAAAAVTAHATSIDEARDVAARARSLWEQGEREEARQRTAESTDPTLTAVRHFQGVEYGVVNSDKEQAVTALEGAIDHVKTSDRRAGSRVRAARASAPVAGPSQAGLLQEYLQGSPQVTLSNLQLSGLPVYFPQGWDPRTHFVTGTEAEWLDAVGLPSLMCRWGDPMWTGAYGADATNDYKLGTGYFGGGEIIGPDGKAYPLVVPRVVKKGVVLGADWDSVERRIQDLEGEDGGWHLVGRHAGFDRLGSVDDATKVAVGGGSLGGLSANQGDLLRRNDWVKRLSVGASGYPTLDADGVQSHNPVGVAPGDPRDNPVDKPPGSGKPLAGVHPERIGAVGGVVDYGITMAKGGLTLQQMSASTNHAYLLSLEQNDDGRRRALLNTYDVYENNAQGGRPTIQSSYGWLDHDGEFRQSPFSFQRSSPRFTPGKVDYSEVVTR